MSPILVRPVREQLEHDRVIRLLQAKYKRKFDVAINPGNEQTAPVGTGPSPWYPDLVLQERGRKLVGVVEVETAESVNNLEAMSQWVAFGKLRAQFHLYVPSSAIDSTRRLCADLGIPVAEIWAYHSIGDQLRFTLVQKTGPGLPKGSPEPRTSAPKAAVNGAGPSGREDGVPKAACPQSPRARQGGPPKVAAKRRPAKAPAPPSKLATPVKKAAGRRQEAGARARQGRRGEEGRQARRKAVTAKKKAVPPAKPGQAPVDGRALSARHPRQAGVRDHVSDALVSGQRASALADPVCVPLAVGNAGRPRRARPRPDASARDSEPRHRRSTGRPCWPSAR